MDVSPIIVLVLSAIFAALAREIYGNKGVFVLPKITDKGLALGSLLSVIAAVFAVMINYTVIPAEITFNVAVFLGISWGVAAPDIVANVIGAVKK